MLSRTFCWKERETDGHEIVLLAMDAGNVEARVLVKRCWQSFLAFLYEMQQRASQDIKKTKGRPIKQERQGASLPHNALTVSTQDESSPG